MIPLVLQVSSILSLANELLGGLELLRSELGIAEQAVADSSAPAVTAAAAGAAAGAEAGAGTVAAVVTEITGTPQGPSAYAGELVSTSENSMDSVGEEQEAHAALRTRVAAWLQGRSGAEQVLRSVEGQLRATLQELCGYFDEAYDAKDPMRCERVWGWKRLGVGGVNRCGRKGNQHQGLSTCECALTQRVWGRVLSSVALNLISKLVRSLPSALCHPLLSLRAPSTHTVREV